MEAVLEIEGLSVDFLTPRGRVHALREVSLRVMPGRIVGIVGESGSGKSTLVLAALALLPGNAEVLAGRVVFGGADLLRLPPAGVLWLVTLLAIDYRRGLGPADAMNVDLAALYWHFVDVIWIVIFTLVYLIQ